MKTKPEMHEKLQIMGLSKGMLSGKVALITGAGRGIGRELARALAWLGARVVIAEISKSGAEVEELIRAEGGTALFIQTDISDEKSIKELVDETIKEFGRVDILVNNAAVVKIGSIMDAPIEDWDTSWAVNVRGGQFSLPRPSCRA